MVFALPFSTGADVTLGETRHQGLRYGLQSGTLCCVLNALCGYCI